MIENAEHRPLSRDDRDELAAVAAAAARRNRPSHLVVAALVLLVGSLAMAGSAYLTRGVAERSLKRYTAENVRATALIERITELRAESSGAPGENDPIGLYDPIGDILTRLINLSTRAGITVGAPQESAPRPVGGFQRREYRYSATVGSIDDLFGWVRLVREEIPGMEVLSISLTPQPANRNWTVTLTFARLERAGA